MLPRRPYPQQKEDKAPVVRSSRRILMLGAALLALPGEALAAEKADECADAYELAQAEQQAGRLFEARKDARLCMAKCPHRLVADCTAWETHITTLIPSFVVHARSPEGAPLAVDVQVDEVPAKPTEAGAIEAEPGTHRLLVRHAGKEVEARVSLVVGERNQIVEVTIDDRPALLPQPPPSDLAGGGRGQAGGPTGDQHPIPRWRWLLGGAGLATVAAGGAISISGEVLDGQLRHSCAPTCTKGQADEVVDRWIIGGAVMGVGGAVFLTALLWPQERPAVSSGGGSAARVLFGPSWVGLQGSF